MLSASGEVDCEAVDVLVEVDDLGSLCILLDGGLVNCEALLLEVCDGPVDIVALVCDMALCASALMRYELDGLVHECGGLALVDGHTELCELGCGPVVLVVAVCVDANVSDLEALDLLDCLCTESGDLIPLAFVDKVPIASTFEAFA